jgi:hypothetical protein
MEESFFLELTDYQMSHMPPHRVFTVQNLLYQSFNVSHVHPVIYSDVSKKQNVTLVATYV